MITLRDYQETGVNAIRVAFRTYDSVLYVAPTGAGKTVIFSYIAANVVLKKKRVLILTHRRNLRKQASGELHNFGISHGIIAAGMPLSKAPVQVGTIQSVSNRMNLIGKFDLIIVDEAHHAVSVTWKQVLRSFLSTGAKVLGVTATPYRGDGAGLGEMFEHLVPGPQPAELIDMGHLCEYRLFAPPQLVRMEGANRRGGDYNWKDQATYDRVDKPAIYGDVIKHYQKIAGGKRAIVFAVSVAHAKQFAYEFNSYGIPAEAIFGSMTEDQIDAVVKRFESGVTLVLLSCDLVTEGFNCPAAEVGILCRPTMSRALYRQMIGRILRLARGKRFAILIDHVGNVRMHGFPDDYDHYSLLGEEKEKRGGNGERETPVSTCVRCYASFRPAAKCPNCGFEQETRGRQIREIEGELVEYTREAEKLTKEEEEKRARTEFQLIAIGRRRGYQYPESWAKAKLREREAKLERERASQHDSH